MALQRRDSSSPSPSISAATPSMPLSPYSLPSPKTPEMSCQPEKQQTFVRVQVAPDARIQSLSLLVLSPISHFLQSFSSVFVLFPLLCCWPIYIQTPTVWLNEFIMST